MKVYNKLVRDKIPEIILKDNELPTTRILDDEEYIKELNRKLQEEVNEYLEAENIEEMVDILEVIRAILEHKGVTYDEIEEKRIKKANKRGAFKEKIFLEKVLQNGD
jgi:predicted house-cleaning noncanonical NTP pyrophosphatase (MazG superfamily)